MSGQRKSRLRIEDALVIVGVLLSVGACTAHTAAPVVERTVLPEPGLTVPRKASAAQPTPQQEAARMAMEPAEPATTTTDSVGTASSPPTPREGASAPQATEEDWRPAQYTVKRGDTLYAIALDHGLDYRDLSAWNAISDPNVIQTNQTLALRAPTGWRPEDASSPVVAIEEQVVEARPSAGSPVVEVRPLDPPPVLKTGPKAIKLAWSERALVQLRADLGLPQSPAAPTSKANPSPPTGIPPRAAPPIAPAPGSVTATIPAPMPPAPQPSTVRAPTRAPGDAAAWTWPASGPLVHGFDQGSNPKGVSIGGQVGQPIVASAAGKVVYSGSGLRGYGKLVIIKHNETYLSVYAHNRELLVKEGDRVARGQKIAEMGNSDAGRAALHFEIRKRGKPVDPLSYLPDAGA